MAQQHTVKNDDEGIRLDRWFKRHYPGLPHALLEKYLRKGMIRVDGRKARTSDRVQAGQVVLCPELSLEERPKPKRTRSVSEQELAEVRRWVLYKDERVIVINKPYGLAVQGGSKISRS